MAKWDHDELKDKSVASSFDATFYKPSKVSDGSSTDYYKFPKGLDDLIDLIEYKNMNFAIGNIFKACFRLGEKAGTDSAYDLRKIIFFAERELKRIDKAHTN